MLMESGSSLHEYEVVNIVPYSPEPPAVQADRQRMMIVQRLSQTGFRYHKYKA